MTATIPTMGGTADEILARVRGGEWPLPGDVATLLGISRKTVDRMLTVDPPTIRHRLRPGPGQYRECHPEDVLRLYEQRHQIRG